MSDILYLKYVKKKVRTGGEILIARESTTKSIKFTTSPKSEK